MEYLLIRPNVFFWAIMGERKFMVIGRVEVEAEFSLG